MKFTSIDIKNPQTYNIIIGRSHFIKTVEDIYEAIVNTVPGARFAIAFNEASSKRLIRFEGNDEELISLACDNAKLIKAGHTFVIFLKDAYPVNLLKTLRSVPEVVEILVATANPLRLILAEEEERAAIIGIMDGYTPLGIENEEDKKERRQFLRNIGYKF